ncbi:MAG: hypothetical protein Q8O42_20605 [Acidobacteriota bacterium]|nr:hypothetical protein [Acidobacteriota bacterium]
MGFKEDLARKIDKKKAEIVDLERQVNTARTYLQALEDTYKLAARDSMTASIYTSEAVRATPAFRVGSMTGQAYAAIKHAGRPLHVNQLLPAIGRSVNRQERSAISGTLAAYVRKGDVFTRPAPNTFGLVEFGDGVLPTDGSTQLKIAPEPPPGFGRI